MPGDGARHNSMKKFKAWLKQLKNNPKFRCGGFSLLLTAAAVICVLLVGLLADTLENRYALQADFSFNAATTQGEVTRAVLDQLEKDVLLYAVLPSSGGDETLMALLGRYEAASPHVTVTEESLLKNPALQSAFSDGTEGSPVTDDCLIVTCPETGRTRVLTHQDYVVYAYDMETGYQYVDSYAYEKNVTEAIVYVTAEDVPTVQFLTGHGEMTETQTSLLSETLISANYQVQRINLAAGDELDSESPLMILCPLYDLNDWELDRLMAFARQGGDFFIASQYSDPTDLSNYNALLRAYGTELYAGLVIAKQEDTESYYGNSPVILMPYMQETDVTRPLLAAGEDILLLSAARAFRLPDLAPEGVMLSPVLVTGQAYLRHFEDGLSVSDQQPGDEDGPFAVALWSEKMFEDGALSRMFLIGDMTMFLDVWMQSNTPSTAFLLQIVRSLQGKTPVNLDILPKAAAREGLALGSLTPAVIVAVMLPLLVLLGAVLVLWPRKNL